MELWNTGMRRMGKTSFYSLMRYFIFISKFEKDQISNLIKNSTDYNALVLSLYLNYYFCKKSFLKAFQNARGKRWIDEKCHWWNSPFYKWNVIILKCFHLSKLIVYQQKKACGFVKRALQYSIFYLPKIFSLKMKMLISNKEK